MTLGHTLAVELALGALGEPDSTIKASELGTLKGR